MLKGTLNPNPALQLERMGDPADDTEVPRIRMGKLNPSSSAPSVPMPRRFSAVEPGAGAPGHAPPYPASPFADAAWRKCTGADSAEGFGAIVPRARSNCGHSAGAGERDGLIGALEGGRVITGAACWGAPGRSDPAGSPVPATVGVMCGGLVGVYDLAAGAIAVRFGEDGRVSNPVLPKIRTLVCNKLVGVSDLAAGAVLRALARIAGWSACLPTKPALQCVQESAWLKLQMRRPYEAASLSRSSETQCGAYM